MCALSTSVPETGCSNTVLWGLVMGKNSSIGEGNQARVCADLLLQTFTCLCMAFVPKYLHYDALKPAPLLFGIQILSCDLTSVQIRLWILPILSHALWTQYYFSFIPVKVPEVIDMANVVSLRIGICKQQARIGKKVEQVFPVGLY